MADKFIYVIVSILLGFGLVFSYSLPVYLETKYGWSEFHFFFRFLGFSVIGLMIMYTLSQCNPDKCIAKIGWGLLFISTITIILMPTPVLSPFCPVIKGARRWIKVAGLSIAPLEFFKIGMIYFFAWGFSRKLRSNHFRTLKEEIKVLIPYALIIGFMGGYVILFQSDLGQVMLIAMIFTIMLTFTNTTYKTFGVIFLAIFGILIFGLLHGGYRVERIKSTLYNIYLLAPKWLQDFFDVKASTIDVSYQIRQSINAIHNGGFTGVGIGNGELKMGFLSDVHTDFVLAGIAEEIGFIGVVAIMSLISLLIWRIFKIANRIETKTHNDYVFRLFAIGVGILIGLETILNIMGIIGLFPLKGLPIPFVSYGGSSIIAFSVAIGMVLMISKKAKV
jgi:cell division protein FtsW